MVRSIRCLSAVMLTVLLGCGSTVSSTVQSALSSTATTTTTVATPVDELVAAVPPGAAADAVAEAAAHADEAVACETGEAWIQAADAAAAALRRAATAARDDALELDDWLFSDDAVALADRLQDSLVEVPDCPGADPGDVLATTGRVSGAIDDYRTATTPGLLGLASGFWLNFDYLGHTIEVDRVQRERGQIEVLVVGDSAAKRGIDPIQIDEATGRPTMNAATDGLLPTMVGPWLDELDELTVRADTVVIGITSWGAVVPCDDPRSALLAAFRQNRTAAFDGLGELEEPPAIRVVGRPTSSHMSPLLERYRRSEGPERQGSFLDSESADPQSVAAQVAYHTQLFSRPIVCDDAVSSVRATATELGANGAEVLVVAMPVSDDMAALHPEGRAGHRSIADRYREAAGAAGAGFVDLTGVLGAEHFHDPAHPNQAGRAIITEQVLAQLT